MKALSLWQPWASAIACGSKTIETRSWDTSYRGRLAIHAAKRCVMRDLEAICVYPCWLAALSPLFSQLPGAWTLRPETLRDILPFGAIVATGRLVNCIPTGACTSNIDVVRRIPLSGRKGSLKWTERDLGDFSPGRFAWILRDVKPINPPVPYRGQRGLFDVGELGPETISTDLAAIKTVAGQQRFWIDME